MTSAPSLGFPGGRTLAGWWRDLAAWRPRSLWIGHLLLHRVEALARVSLRTALDPFDHLALKALAVEGEATTSDVDTRLRLGPQVVGAALRGLRAEGLAEACGEGRWRLTPLGQQAAAGGGFPRDAEERRAFYFVDRPRAGDPPHFLNLHPAGCMPWPAAEGWEFDAAVLRACLERPAGWKQQYGFPADVREILGGPGAAPGTRPWQPVIIDHPQRLVAALVLAPGEGDRERLLAFAVRPEGWLLRSAEPVLSLADGWHEPFPELAEEPSAERWREAWWTWCQPRGLTNAAAETTDVRRDGHRLRVTVSPRLLERLRAARSDALKGEAWVLAGDGRIRAAALLEVVPGPERSGRASGW
jgi:DNA-binding transcriptional ArsR family regulator